LRSHRLSGTGFDDLLPALVLEDRSEADIWFEREMPSAATRPLFEEESAPPWP